jgi:hypothetical protein
VQAVVSVNTLVRQKGTEAGLTEGVWSLVQQYEGQLVGMTQYVLQETLPGLTHYVETRASDFLVSHNLSKVRRRQLMAAAIDRVLDTPILCHPS